MPRNPPPMPPVGLLSELAPVDHPQFLPSSPHRLPPLGERPPKRELQTMLYGPVGFGPQASPGAPADAVDTNTFERHRYATLIEGNTGVGLASAQFLQEPNTKRNFLGLRNASAAGGANIYIGFAKEASVASWLVLIPGQVILFDVSVPQDDLYAVADAAGALLSYAFSTFSPE